MSVFRGTTGGEESSTCCRVDSTNEDRQSKPYYSVCESTRLSVASLNVLPPFSRISFAVSVFALSSATAVSVNQQPSNGAALLQRTDQNVKLAQDRPIESPAGA